MREDMSTQTGPRSGQLIGALSDFEGRGCQCPEPLSLV